MLTPTMFTFTQYSTQYCKKNAKLGGDLGMSIHIHLKVGSLVPRSSPAPVFDHLQYEKWREKTWSFLPHGPWYRRKICRCTTSYDDVPVLCDV